jgi:hypothetical protein
VGQLKALAISGKAVTIPRTGNVNLLFVTPELDRVAVRKVAEQIAGVTPTTPQVAINLTREVRKRLAELNPKKSAQAMIQELVRGLASGTGGAERTEKLAELVPPIKIWVWGLYDPHGGFHERVSSSFALFDATDERVDAAFVKVRNGTAGEGGTPVNSDTVRPWVNAIGSAAFPDRPITWTGGHVIPKVLGGPGELGNIIPQSNPSQGSLSKSEAAAKVYVDNNPPTGYLSELIALHYPRPSAAAPDKAERLGRLRVPDRIYVWFYGQAMDGSLSARGVPGPKEIPNP